MPALWPNARFALAFAWPIIMAVTAFGQADKKDEPKQAAGAKVYPSRTKEAPTAVKIESRPNNSDSVFLILERTDPAPQPKTYRVVLKSGPATIAVSEPLTLAAGDKKAITLAPAEAKKEAPAPKKDAEAKKDAPPPAAPAAPPAGVPVKATASVGIFALQYEVQTGDFTKPDVVGSGNVEVTVQEPTAYVKPDGDPVLKSVDTLGSRNSLTAKLIPTENKIGPPAEVSLSLPPQRAFNAGALRSGSYKRNITLEKKPENAVELKIADMAGTKPNEDGRIYVNIDSVPRVYIYKFSTLRTFAGGANVEPDKAPAIRLFPLIEGPKGVKLAEDIVSGTATNPRLAVRPTTALKFRVEVDNPPQNATVQVHVDRNGENKFTALDEVVLTKGQPRDTQVFVNVAGPEGSVVFANTVTDHIVTIDVSALRGAHQVRAQLVSGTTTTAATIDMIVDDTAPPTEEVAFATTLPRRVVKGDPVALNVRASDPETNITKVTFVLAKPGPDGKLPEDAPKFDAIKQPILGGGKIWVAAVQLPPPAPAKDPKAAPKGPAELPVTVVAENEVGMSITKLGTIELVDPKGATIEVKVERGGRGQPDTVVSLRDGEGKEKGSAKSNAKGVAKFENVAPGVYRIVTAKPDSSTGLIGVGTVQVPDPAPLPKDPVKVTLDLIKRR